MTVAAAPMSSTICGMQPSTPSTAVWASSATEEAMAGALAARADAAAGAACATASSAGPTMPDRPETEDATPESAEPMSAPIVWPARAAPPSAAARAPTTTTEPPKAEATPAAALTAAGPMLDSAGPAADASPLNAPVILPSGSCLKAASATSISVRPLTTTPAALLAPPDRASHVRPAMPSASSRKSWI